MSASRIACHTLLAILALQHTGCGTPEIDATYGRSSGPEAASVNGTSVLAGMFEIAGHQVGQSRLISPALSRFDVVVWAPDDFNAPSFIQRVALEQWLARGQRTLVYVGRDFDATPQYWRAIAARLPAPQRWAAEAHAAEAMAEHDQQRALSSKTQFARWFTLDREHGWQKVGSLQSSHGWADGLDMRKTDLFIGARLVPPEASNADSSQAEFFFKLYEDAVVRDELAVQSRPADSVEVLLASDDVPLVLRVRDRRWPSSQILVVSNGSFLLNLPLINHEHRKLAGKLIAACGPPSRVGFLETAPGDRGAYFSEPEAERQTGLEVLTVWPLGFILMHAMLLGLAICLAVFPVFGRPRGLPRESTGDFAKHIEALGRLLERTQDQQYAREQLRLYHGQGHGHRSSPPLA